MKKFMNSLVFIDSENLYNEARKLHDIVNKNQHRLLELRKDIVTEVGIVDLQSVCKKHAIKKVLFHLQESLEILYFTIQNLHGAITKISSMYIYTPDCP